MGRGGRGQPAIDLQGADQMAGEQAEGAPLIGPGLAGAQAALAGDIVHRARPEAGGGPRQHEAAVEAAQMVLIVGRTLDVPGGEQVGLVEHGVAQASPADGQPPRTVGEPVRAIGVHLILQGGRGVGEGGRSG